MVKRFVFVFVVLIAAGSQAATYSVFEDREMVQRADDIVVVTGVTLHALRNERGAIVTRFTLRVEESLKGGSQRGDHLVVTEVGGQLGEKIYYVPGSPVYEPGVRYVVFTETNGAGDPITLGMSLGQFELVEQHGRRLALRSDIVGFDGNLEPHVERARDAARFIDYIRGLVAQTIDPTPGYFLDGVPADREADSRWEIEEQFTRSSYLMQANGRGFRWNGPAFTFRTAGTAAGVDGQASVDLALAQWNATDSSIDIAKGPPDNSETGPVLCSTCDDGKSTILLNDPANEVASGIAGRGGVFADSTYTFEGEEFYRAKEGDLVMNDGVIAQSCYNTVMVHEMGHCLGLRHSNQPPAGGENTTNAIMNSVVSCGWNGVLKQYDKDAAATVYGTGPVCNTALIRSQTPDQKILPGRTAQLSVTATGTGALHYSWFEGEVDDVSKSVGSDSSVFITPELKKTTKYWVRVTNECGSTKSAAITVEVIKTGRRRAVRS